MARKYTDITGLRVGKVVVSHKTNVSGPAKWLCLCDCGNTCEKYANDLLNTIYTHCGCEKGKLHSRRKDHTNMRYGNVVGVEPTSKIKNSQIVWVWKCDCGAYFESVAGNFVFGKQANCPDCARENGVRERAKKTTKHGMVETKEYRTWCHIKERCFNKNDKSFSGYGDRGITMYEPWVHNFDLFFEHVGFAPKEGKWSLDRIDNTGNYEPGNVRWATDQQQARNKGKNCNNTSNVTGVRLDCKSITKDGKRCEYWTAQWMDQFGKLCKAAYSIKKYGDEKAFFLACERRELEITKLNLILGEQGYSKNHGK